MEFVNDDSYQKLLLWLKLYMNSMIRQDSNEGFKYRKKIFKIVMCKIMRLQNFI